MEEELSKQCIIYSEEIDWFSISAYKILSESFIREFKDKIDWFCISKYQALSESFIREFKDKVEWNSISVNQTLSEDFIREFRDKIDWDYISVHQKLSEDFIREFKNKVYWNYISRYQKLSEDFIREFITEFRDKINWNYISVYQTLSESFIREFKDKVDWINISKYQRLSESFRKEFNIEIDNANWLYKDEEFIYNYIKKHNLDKIYKLKEDKNGKYILAYKAVKRTNSSVYSNIYRYFVGQEYESNCDCNIYVANSFGLSAWTKDKALNYYNEGKLLVVKIYLKDIGAIVNLDNKIRCRKLTVLEEVEK